ncbi:hypothetical protein K8I31_09815 [bacterium]|nr:hypothetical protein [bacterium]
MPGNWDFVTGYFGFWHTFEEGQKLFVVMIGTQTNYSAPNNYESAWDKKVFWLDIGSGQPMHVSAEYWTDQTDEESGELQLIYYCPSFTLREPGVEYNNSDFGAQAIDLWLFVDPETYEVENYEIDLLNDDGEVVETRQLQSGDEILSWTQCYDVDDPEIIYLATMEEDHHPIASDAQF